jgi:hypothetical protein
MVAPIAPTVSIETLTPFETAVKALRKFRHPGFERAARRLANLSFTVRAAQILRELAPDRLADYGAGVRWLDDEDKQDDLARATMAAIGEIAPLDDETVEIEIEDGQFRLIPAAMGYPMNWDEWGELVADPDNYIDQAAAAWAFCSALAIGDQGAFESFSEHFDWDLRWPKRAGGTYDKEKLFRGFDRHGLSCFKAAWNIAIYSTGNLYFDYNIYDDNVDLPDFDIDGVRELEWQYKAARLIQDEYRLAQELFNTRTDVPKALLRIYAHSLVKDEETPHGRTLGEVFRAEQEAMAAREADEEDEENDETDPLNVLEGHRVRVRV